MRPEIVMWSVPCTLFAIWFIVAPHSATRFYESLYRRRHGRWFPQALRVGGVVILVVIILVLTGVLR